jgi:hypothetical protein
MKIILAITSIVTLIAILEAAGVVEWIDEDTVVLKGFCDNTARTPDKPEDGGGTGMSKTEVTAAMESTYGLMSTAGIKMQCEYFLSKTALDNLFNDDLTATGIFVAPILDASSNMNVIVGTSHMKNTIVEGTGYGYVIKTFCPDACEVISRPMPSAATPSRPH